MGKKVKQTIICYYIFLYFYKRYYCIIVCSTLSTPICLPSLPVCHLIRSCGMLPSRRGIIKLETNQMPLMCSMVCRPPSTHKFISKSIYYFSFVFTFFNNKQIQRNMAFFTLLRFGNLPLTCSLVTNNPVFNIKGTLNKLFRS